MTFKDLGLSPALLQAITQKGYQTPTPIQKQAIPLLLQGHDLLGCAQTGTGKTAAFAIPIIQQLLNDKSRDTRNKKIKALIVTPTRELAIQIKDNFVAYGKETDIRSAVIFGGVKQGKQTATLKQGVDILIATPGRLLDLISQGFITLKHLEYFVLDEADQMLDMGFIHDIKKIIQLIPEKRQSLFFSATMPKSILDLSKRILGQPKKITIKPEQTTAEKVTQQLYYVSKADKPKLLEHLVVENENAKHILVFSRTKHGADKIVRKLKKVNIGAEAIHGNKSQNQRQRALNSFKEGKTKVLVATDIAARGIDVSGLDLVINYDLPNVPETYVHRIGRTGRADASGIAVSFCDIEERPYLRSIQKLIGQSISVVSNHLFVDQRKEEDIKQDAPSQKKKKTPGRRGNKNVWNRRRPQNKAKKKSNSQNRH
ncbi:DEAD/DEAH box helicase [Crocinitomix algicola]|uniref:DEAD/DEAH box helicase n=1 Tax=Crocinitomix algicola TaxID=1740263 RepID=UPI000834E57B|nr:DEAD/DEAH box helicase [Crocinitomix algicola]